VPEDWFAANVDHWLWLQVRFFGDSGSEASGEDDGFHFLSNENEEKLVAFLVLSEVLLRWGSGITPTYVREQVKSK